MQIQLIKLILLFIQIDNNYLNIFIYISFGQTLFEIKIKNNNSK